VTTASNTLFLRGFNISVSGKESEQSLRICLISVKLLRPVNREQEKFSFGGLA